MHFKNKMEFDLLGSDNNVATIEIRNPSSTVEFEENNTVYDIRLGAFKRMKCGTCKANEETCPGHFGYVHLAMPVLNPFLINDVLLKILKRVCFRCLDINCKCTVESSNSNAKKRKLVNDRLSWSLQTQKNWSEDNQGCRFVIKDENGEVRPIFVLYGILEKLSVDLTKEFLPKHGDRRLVDLLFIENLLILPTSLRPPNFVKGVWMPDGISTHYNNILRQNHTLINAIKSKKSSTNVYENHMILQDYVNMLFDRQNTCSKYKYVFDGIRQRLNGKSGIIRSNLMGKRVNQSARTVLSGDPKLSLNQIGVPRRIADNLSIPVVINRYNINQTFRKVKYIVKNNQRYDMSIVKKKIKIEIGDTVERSLEDGDLVVINRQPSLHRGSMMAAYVKIIDALTFRLNYSTMISLNADCDGDEINIHVPQDLNSRAELEQLMLVSINIVSSQMNKPVLGLSQDSLLGMHLLSKYKKLTLEEIMDIMSELDVTYVDIDRKRTTFTGTEVIQMILNHLNFHNLNYNHEGVEIKDGVITESSVLTKKHLGPEHLSLIHIVYLYYGHLKCNDFMFLMQQAATMFLNNHGFSVGIQDCLANDYEIDYNGLEKQIKQDWMQRKLDEPELLNALSNMVNIEHNKIDLMNQNAFVTMSQAGSKGSIINYNQIKTAVGQQIDEGTRIKPQFKDRTLPHFNKYDETLEARGFVKSSFIKGLTPIEFFFHAKSSRDSLIDTACKTATTGYCSRKLVKSMERNVICDDGLGNRMVKNMDGDEEIISFRYGSDNLDPTYKINL